MTWDIPAMVQSGLEIIDKVIPDADAKNRAREAWQLKVLEIAAAEAQQQSQIGRAHV